MRNSYASARTAGFAAIDLAGKAATVMRFAPQP